MVLSIFDFLCSENLLFRISVGFSDPTGKFGSKIWWHFLSKFSLIFQFTPTSCDCFSTKSYHPLFPTNFPKLLHKFLINFIKFPEKLQNWYNLTNLHSAVREWIRKYVWMKRKIHQYLYGFCGGIGFPINPSGNWLFILCNFESFWGNFDGCWSEILNWVLRRVFSPWLVLFTMVPYCVTLTLKIVIT